LGTGDIDTMQVLASTRTLDTSTTSPLVCLLSTTFAHQSISTGKERDSESGNDYFEARYYASSMGRWLSPDPGGMAVVDLEFPQTLNRYAYVNNNPLSFTDPFGLDCAYLNNAGNGVESVDQQSSAGECGKSGGYWVNGGLTNININADQGSVQMTGTTNGTDQTHASYQDANVVVSEWNNTIANPANHIAISLPGQRPVGQNPLSDSDFISNIALNGFKYNVVPGTIKPQTNTGKLLKVAVVPVTGMQAKMIQAFINQSMANPSNYSLNTQLGLDCATWVQQLLGNAGVQTGPMQPMPDDLMNQLGSMYKVY